LIKKASIVGAKLETLLVQDIAHVVSKKDQLSSLFKFVPSDNRGRYAFVGFAPRFEYLNENGKELLARTVNWVNCGNINC